MSKRAPSTTQLLVIAGLRAVVLRDPALPLDHLRRPDPVQGETVRNQDPLQRGDPAGRTVRRADLRRRRRQSAEHRAGPQPQAGAGDDLHRRQVRAAAALDPGDARAPRPCSARPTSNSRPAAATAPSSPTAPPFPPRRSNSRSSSMRSSAPSTRRPAPPSRAGCRKPPSRSGARAHRSPPRSANFDPTFTEFDRLFRVLDTQRLAVRQLFSNGAVALSSAARPPGRAGRA